MNGFIDNDDYKSWMDSLRYREVVIKHNNKKYHIEAYPKKYLIGLFKKKEYEIEQWFEVKGDSYDDAFDKLMNEPLFDGSALKDIINDIEWLEG